MTAVYYIDIELVSSTNWVLRVFPGRTSAVTYLTTLSVTWRKKQEAGSPLPCFGHNPLAPNHQALCINWELLKIQVPAGSRAGCRVQEQPDGRKG